MHEIISGFKEFFVILDSPSTLLSTTHNNTVYTLNNSEKKLNTRREKDILIIFMSQFYSSLRLFALANKVNHRHQLQKDKSVYIFMSIKARGFCRLYESNLERIVSGQRIENVTGNEDIFYN